MVQGILGALLAGTTDHRPAESDGGEGDGERSGSGAEQQESAGFELSDRVHEFSTAAGDGATEVAERHES
jgi:hypothetical protein